MKSASLSFCCQGLRCVLQRSTRKTVSLLVRPDGTVLVKGPRRLSTDEAADIVTSHIGWVLQRLNALENARQQPLFEGEALCLMGKTFSVQRGEKAGWGEDFLCLTQDEPDLNAAVAALCMKMAKKVFTERAAEFAPRLGVQPGIISIGRANGTWGSCKRDGSLRFSWKALFCGPRELDYLTVHELCHLKHFDHSPAFWAMVESVAPDYRECRARMNDTARRIAAQGWQKY